MKAAILLVAGSVGLLASPAVAGNSKQRDSKKPTVASVEKTEAAKAEVAAPELARSSIDLPGAPAIEIPDLPVDTSSPFASMPELEKTLASTTVKPMVKSKKDKAPVMRMGKNYVLGNGPKRESAKPTLDVVHVVPKGLTQSQVATVVQSHMSEIQSCWTAVPKQLRVDACTADLMLSISDSGQVTDIELGGDVPASAHKCITSAISRWQFPAAEIKSDVEYGISLRSL